MKKLKCELSLVNCNNPPTVFVKNYSVNSIYAFCTIHVGELLENEDYATKEEYLKYKKTEILK